MAETKKWTALATAIARCQVVSEGVREQLAPLIKESSALNARLDEVAAKLEHVDANVARRTTELGDSVRALAEDTETRSEVTRRELLVHIDELRKKKSFFG
jgi:hypothetical protein